MASSVVTCVPLRTSTELQVSIPGVGILRSVKQAVDEVPSPASLAMTMLAQISPAMAPLVAIMRVVDVLGQIIQTFNSVKSLNPIEIGNAILTLAKKVGVLAEFLPGLSYIAAVRDLMALTADLLRGVGTLILRWIVELDGISKAIEAAKVLQDPELSFASDCSTQRLFEVRLATQVSLQDIGQLLKVIKIVIDIVKSFVPVDIKELSTVADGIEGVIDVIAGSGTIASTAAEAAGLQKVALELQSIAHLLDQLVAKLSLLIAT